MILVDNRNSSNPYINLAIEEYLIRNVNCYNNDYLFLYINEPCIVLGKNQSIWKEVNFEYLRNQKLKLCRRISGGGTVYQDKGNLCFAFISKFSENKVNNYKFFNQPLITALQKAGINVEMDPRNNILFQGKKFSGNAQFTNRKNIISHGTILFNTDLKTLRAGLKRNDFKIESRAISSVRSSVMNINEVTDKFSSTQVLKNYLSTELNVNAAYAFNKTEWNTIQQLAKEKFCSFEWVYGRSPATKITREEIEIVIEGGKIASINNEASFLLEGVAYEYTAIKKALRNFPNASKIVKRIF